jgi:hypothetical protein
VPLLNLLSFSLLFFQLSLDLLLLFAFLAASSFMVPQKLPYTETQLVMYKVEETIARSVAFLLIYDKDLQIYTASNTSPNSSKKILHRMERLVPIRCFFHQMENLAGMNLMSNE